MLAHKYALLRHHNLQFDGPSHGLILANYIDFIDYWSSLSSFSNLDLPFENLNHDIVAGNDEEVCGSFPDAPDDAGIDSTLTVADFVPGIKVLA